MSELNWYWAYIPYLDTPEKQKESAISAGYGKVVFKSEADKVIAYHKYKRCLAMADYAMYHHYRMLEIYGRSLDNDRAVFKINYGLRWRWRWLALADKFTVKEAK